MATSQSQQPAIGTTDQQLQLRHLNQAGVRYLAFGDFALGTLRQTNISSTIQLWIEPTKDNIGRINQAFAGMYGPDTDKQLSAALADNPKTQLVLSTAQTAVGSLPGAFTRRQSEPGLKLYTGIYGFTDGPAAFESAWERRQTGPLTALGADRKLSGRITYNQLGLADLRQNVTASASRAKDFMLRTIAEYAAKKNIDMPGELLAGHRNTPERPLRTDAPALPVPTQTDLPGQTQSGLLGTRVTGTAPSPRVNRDISQIREHLDIELVLQHYGYEFNAKKGQPGHKWRVYDQPDTGDRIMVVADSETRKLFHNMETGQRGGAINFIMGQEQETSMGPATWKRIDAILTGEDYAGKKARLNPLDSLAYPITDARLRQIDLVDQYQIQPLRNPAYLTDRAITPATLSNPEFSGRIKTAISSGQKNGQAYAWENIAFPLCVETGQMVSLDMRNKNAAGQTFKAFPKGARGSAVWHSNPVFETKELLIHQPDAYARMRAEGAIITPPGEEVPAWPRQVIPVGTRGTIYQSPNQKVAIFDYQDALGNRAQTLVYPEGIADKFKRGQADRIIVCESPVDSISFAQLNPPLPGEHRLYVATCGTPGAGQKTHINTLLKENPGSQLVIAQDGDNAGLRFAINYLALTHPAADPANTVIPHIAYQSGDSQKGQGPRQEVTGPIQIGSVLLPVGATGYIESSPAGVGDQFVFTDAQGKELRKELSDEERKNSLREAPKGRNTLDIILRATTDGTAPERPPEQARRANEAFIETLTESLRKIVRKETFSSGPEDTDYKVTVRDMTSRQETLPGQTGAGAGGATEVTGTRATISFPNQSNLLIRALQLIDTEYQRRQGRPLMQIIRPTPIQKDFNDVLQARKGKPFTDEEPGNLRTGPKPDLTRRSPVNLSIDTPQRSVSGQPSAQMSPAPAGKPEPDETRPGAAPGQKPTGTTPGTAPGRGLKTSG